ncbi:MAG: hypothetical protein P1V34_02325, partial [Alphaproteobacteria bacterium]|nr:hypothetical protein [Alphaproteobacteria bacterium]
MASKTLDPRYSVFAPLRKLGYGYRTARLLKLDFSMSQVSADHPDATDSAYSWFRLGICLIL